MSRPTTRQLLQEIEQLHDDEHTDTRIGPSDYGRCQKQIELRVKGTPEDDPIEDSHAAIIGTMIHAAFAAHITEKYGSAAEAERRVAVPGLDRTGSADSVWVTYRTVVDLKTVSSRAFDRVLTHGAKPENIGQVDAYALGLNREGVEILSCVLAYVNRENGDVHEIEWEYDEENGQRAVDWLSQTELMIDAGMDMPRAGNGPYTGFPCDWCPFWRTCWDVENTPADRSHASKYTRDDEVEQLVDTYIDSGEVKREAEAAQKAARARLVGISYELNGRKLGWSNGGRVRLKTEDVIDVEALTAAAVEAGLPVPMMTVESYVSPRINAKRTNTQKGAGDGVA